MLLFQKFVRLQLNVDGWIVIENNGINKTEEESYWRNPAWAPPPPHGKWYVHMVIEKFDHIACYLEWRTVKRCSICLFMLELSLRAYFRINDYFRYIHNIVWLFILRYHYLSCIIEPLFEIEIVLLSALKNYHILLGNWELSYGI
jgi:hypothetical protein